MTEVLLNSKEIRHIRDGKKTRFLCRCQCGTMREVSSSSLKRGDTTSCGCLQAKTFGFRVAMAFAERRLKQDGGYMAPSQTRTYRSWKSMMQRCLDPKNASYERYGGKGIIVCERWQLAYGNFFADMGERPKGRSLDRIDRSKGYEASNCRWATAKEQARNHSRAANITHGGQTLSFAEWAEKTGLSGRLICQRVRSGWPVALALTTPPKATRKSV